mgnify:CR=1 FL=1|tara:strand:+ start:1292 stop:1738 length:447 start_codon:yes stop_codon:yes gene_type:complete
MTAKLEKPTLKSKKTKIVPTKAHDPNYGGARPGAGRMAFEPTDSERKQVEALSGYGLPIEQIAVLVRDGIHVDTLRSHFGTELVSGKAKANGQVGKTLFQKVMAGDTTAAIWWSKTQMRWAETQKHEVTGADGAPLEFREIKRVVVKA